MPKDKDYKIMKILILLLFLSGCASPRADVVFSDIGATVQMNKSGTVKAKQGDKEIEYSTQGSGIKETADKLGTALLLKGVVK